MTEAASRTTLCRGGRHGSVSTGRQSLSVATFDAAAPAFWRWDRSAWGQQWAARQGARRATLRELELDTEAVQCSASGRAAIASEAAEAEESDGGEAAGNSCQICLASHPPGREVALECCDNSICRDCMTRVKACPFCRQRLSRCQTIATTHVRHQQYVGPLPRPTTSHHPLAAAPSHAAVPCTPDSPLSVALSPIPPPSSPLSLGLPSGKLGLLGRRQCLLHPPH